MAVVFLLFWVAQCGVVRVAVRGATHRWDRLAASPNGTFVQLQHSGRAMAYRTLALGGPGQEWDEVFCVDMGDGVGASEPLTLAIFGKEQWGPRRLLGMETVQRRDLWAGVTVEPTSSRAIPVQVQMTLIDLGGMCCVVGVRVPLGSESHRAGQGRAGQGRAGRGRAGQGRAGQGIEGGMESTARRVLTGRRMVTGPPCDCCARAMCNRPSDGARSVCICVCSWSLACGKGGRCDFGTEEPVQWTLCHIPGEVGFALEGGGPSMEPCKTEVVAADELPPRQQRD